MATKRRVVNMVALFSLALVLQACASSGVNKGDFNIISLQEEWQLGQQLEQDIAKQMQLVNDPQAQAYLDSVGQRIVNQTPMAELPWHFHLVRNPEINAFATPGGQVYVNTGLIAAAGNVSEFSGVLAHEISHGIARHSTEQLSKAYGLEVLAGLALGQNPPLYKQILAQIVGQGAMARFSRQAEKEADDLGVKYMYQAGYDPNGMVSMFQELLGKEQRSPNSVEKFFSTHPLTQDRIEDVRRQIAKLPPKGGLTTTDPNYRSFRSRVAG